MTLSNPYKDYSQSGEQAILINTFDQLPAQSERWCVEFGAWDGKHFSNTYYLISQKNWNGVLIESDSAKFELLKSNFQQNTKTILLNKTVNFEGSDRLDKILRSTPIPHDFDLLSIDVDGNDWHIWESIEEYRPKVVVIEFNPSIPSDIEFVQPKDLSINQGTSLLYIVNHVKDKGYELFNTTKCNAFFIQRELYPLLNIADNSIQILWKTEKKAPRIFQLYDGTLVLDKEFKLKWRQKKVGRFDLQALPESQRFYQPKQSPNLIISAKLQRLDLFQNSVGVIHIGANSGQERDIYQMYKLAVLWVEADPDTYITLEENVKTYPNQTAVQSLLLDRDGIDSPFYISTNHAASSSIYPMAQHKKFWPRVDYANEITLKSESLTTLVNRITLDLTLYDTMVLDTQGSELRVLQGGADILWGIHTIIVEAADCELYHGGCYDSEIAEFLKPFGFVEIERWVIKSITGVGSCYNVVYQKPIFKSKHDKPIKKETDKTFFKKSLKDSRRTLIDYGLPPNTFRTDINEINDIVRRLRPYKSGHPLRRFGPEKDGGYLIPDDIAEITACFSPGIGNTSGFELDCYKNGMKIFLADKSILPQASYPFEFNYLPKFLGKETKDDFISMTDWLTESEIDITKDLLLQMDIEAFEYETLKEVSLSTLNRFRIIVIELHFLDLLIYKPWFEKIAPIIKLLTTNHTVVHLHPNNCCGIFKTGSLEIPRTLEVTFLRNDRFKEKSPAMEFPNPLDCNNTNGISLNLPVSWYKTPQPCEKIKAIVLTYDRNHIITEHMIACYQKIWPDNPFVFHIPYQNPAICKPADNKVYINTPDSFRQTVLGLLEGIPDDEWVYWCIDDKYPIKFIKESYDLVIKNLNLIPKTIASILLCRAAKLLLEEYVRDTHVPQLELEVLERISLHQFWLHQFIRAKLLRRIFNSVPDNVETPRNMVQYTRSTKLYEFERLIVSKKNNIIFGESTAKGGLTENCRLSLKENGFPMPEFFTGRTSSSFLIGSLD